MTEQRIRLVAGLGNPGDRYRATRHNVGFMVADRFGDRLACDAAQAKFNGLVRDCRTDHGRVMLLKPMTFMNLSGRSVVQAVRWFDVEPEDLLVVYDDLDLPFGEIRLRARGSAAGHNGLSSIVEQMGSSDVPRLRVGIGRPSVGQSRSYVLSRFRPDEEAELPHVLDHAADAILHWLEHGLTETMNRFNGVNVLASEEQP